VKKLAYTLLVFGFLWMEFFALEAGPLARAADAAHRQKLAQQQEFSRQDVVRAFSDAAFQVADFAQLGGIGGALMLAGGFILVKTGRRISTTKAPPVLETLSRSTSAAGHSTKT
jgi:hypothetical protein